MSAPAIQTERLILRQWQQSDVEPFTAMNMDSRVMHYFPAIQTKEDTLAHIERINAHFARHGFGLFAIERKDSRAFIGYTGLTVPRFESFFTPCIEIGWRLSSANWSQGFAQEAAKACLDFGFEILSLQEIYSFTSIYNLPSINVMKRIGMIQVGYFEHPLLADGHKLKKHVIYKVERQ